MSRRHARPFALPFVVAAAATFVITLAPSGLAGANVTTTLPGPLFGVDAINANDVWAVGERPNPADPDEDIGQAQHWNGAAWTEFPTPSFGDAIEGNLVDVSARTATDAWAVGSKGQPSFRDRQVVAEHWNGAAWSLSPAADASFNDVLAGVSAVGPSDVWAVGSYDTGGTARNHLLIEHWNGASWSIVAHPDILGELDAVVAVSTNDVWAVGSSGGKTLAMHWDGATWAQVPTPNKGTATNSLVDISARSATSILAVGTADFGQPFPGKTVALSWNGAAWSLQPTPTPSSGDTVTGVSLPPTGRPWMVGTYWPTATFFQALAERRTSSGWQQVPVGHTTFEGVAALSDSDAWAVGAAIYRWNGSSWNQVVAPCC